MTRMAHALILALTLLLLQVDASNMFKRWRKKTARKARKKIDMHVRSRAAFERQLNENAAGRKSRNATPRRKSTTAPKTQKTKTAVPVSENLSIEQLFNECNTYFKKDGKLLVSNLLFTSWKSLRFFYGIAKRKEWTIRTEGSETAGYKKIMEELRKCMVMLHWRLLVVPGLANKLNCGEELKHTFILSMKLLCEAFGKIVCSDSYNREWASRGDCSNMRKIRSWSSQDILPEFLPLKFPASWKASEQQPPSVENG